MSVETDAAGFVSARSSQSSTPVAQEEDVFDFKGLDDVEQFIERKHFVTDTFEYPRNGSDAGFVLIFNQEDFQNLNSRVGTRRDVNELVTCLQRQGFNIGKNSVMHNATADEIKEKLKEVSVDEHLKECNCLLVFFLTHGKQKDELLTKDGSITTYEVWENFINCKYLENKPKMFVFQACKGTDFSSIKTNYRRNMPEIVHIGTFSSTYLGPDMLVAYSSIEGDGSFRNPLTGSWFIQELCKNITAYGKRDDVFSIITRTTKCVAGNYFLSKKGVNRKQMPVCMSTLSKKFYLNSNKDRALVLMSKSHYEDVLDHIKEVKNQVDKLIP